VRTLQLDHLVVAARTLDEGVAWCEATLGIVPGAGGTHALMGTHNRLFSVASDAFERAYFEIIAIDPAAPPPGRARWFGLDDFDASRGPRLVTFVARTPSLDDTLAALRGVGIDAGRALAASRATSNGLLQWRIAVRDDGRVLHGGALPTLIEWGERHPADTMQASGVSVQALTLRGLPRAVVATLDAPGLVFADDAGPALTARLSTPRGTIDLSTD
jgi:hypothetical protein